MIGEVGPSASGQRAKAVCLSAAFGDVAVARAAIDHLVERGGRARVRRVDTTITSNIQLRAAPRALSSGEQMRRPVMGERCELRITTHRASATR